MKKYLQFLTIAMTVVMVIFSCSNDNLTTTTNENESKNQNSSFQLNMWKMTAETKIIETAEHDKNWENAQISGYNYWYNPMIENSPAYVEFKVTKDGKDAGYVMVSTTEQDFEVPEYCTEGKTMYEQLQNKAGTDNIKATRFNSFDYMAETSTGRGYNNKVFFGDIAHFNNTQTGRGNDEYEEYLTKYIAFRKKIGGIGGCKEELAKHYEMKKEEQEAIGRGDANLYSDMYTYINKEELLPKYNQYELERGGQSGCAPTAATEVFAYWHRYHGYVRFFNNKPALTKSSMSENEQRVVEEIGSSKYMNTKNGSTSLYNAWDGLWRYIYDHGYNHLCIRYYWVDHNSDEASSVYVNTFADWNTIFSEIKADRPALLQYKEKSGEGHSAVIVNLKIKRNSSTGFVNDVECKVEMGWGEDTPRKVVNAGSYYLHEVVTCKIY